MSRLDDIMADVGLPALDEHVADDVTHWPEGDSARATTVRAIVEWDEREGGPLKDQLGERDNRMVTLQILTPGFTFDRADQFQLADGTVAKAQRLLGRDGSGRFPVVQCVVPQGLTTKRR